MGFSKLRPTTACLSSPFSFSDAMIESGDPEGANPTTPLASKLPIIDLTRRNS